MGHSIGDGIIATAIAALVLGYLYFLHRQKMGRLEVVHKERLEAMEKGIPLPELPLDPPPVYAPPNPHTTVMIGIMLTAFGAGTMIVLATILTGEHHRYWITPLPITFMGLGLALYSFLAASRREGA